MAVLTILVVGEREFFSTPVNYQTGRWLMSSSPVAGTILVVAGSIYVVIAEGRRKERQRFRADGDDFNDADSSVVERTTCAFMQSLIKFNDLFDAPSWLFDQSEFQRGQKKYTLPPGEKVRNLHLTRTIEEYETSRTSGESLRSAVNSCRSFTGSTAPAQRERTANDAEPDAPPPTRKRMLTLPEAETPPRRRRSRCNSSSRTPLDPIVLHDPIHPTITFEPGGVNDEAGTCMTR